MNNQTKKQLKECCKQSKNWEDYAVIGSEEGPWVAFRCIKCGEEHGMLYSKYLDRLRKDNPGKKFVP